MRLFNTFKKKDKLLTVAEAKEKLYTSLSEYTGWKYLKSQCCIRKRVGDIVFDINFYSSKWNVFGEHIEVQCEFAFWSKQFDKICNVNSKIGFVSLQPKNNDWYDIYTEKKLHAAIVDLKGKIDDYAIPLVKRFEDDYCDAIAYLSDDDMRDLYHLRFELFDKMKVLSGKS